jgi:hypothetical protein
MLAVAEKAGHDLPGGQCIFACSLLVLPINYTRGSALQILASHFFKKNSKKNLKKKFLKIFREFFWLSTFRSQFGVCLRKFGESRPAGLGGDRDCTDSTKLLFIYRYVTVFVTRGRHFFS